MMRRGFYAKEIRRGKMDPAVAERRIQEMLAIVGTLHQLLKPEYELQQSMEL
jgi:hypothetical protein